MKSLKNGAQYSIESGDGQPVKVHPPTWRFDLPCLVPCMVSRARANSVLEGEEGSGGSGT